MLLALKLRNYVALSLYLIVGYSEPLKLSSCYESYALVGALPATGTLFRSAIHIRTSLPFIRSYGNNGRARPYCFKPQKSELDAVISCLAKGRRTTKLTVPR